jgi:hypothetical protein
MFISKLPELMKRKALETGLPCNNTTLAKATGLMPSTVGRHVRGHLSQIDGETARLFADYFGVSSIADIYELAPSKPLS